MKREQPRDEEPAEQLGEHVDRKKEGRPRRDPALAVERDPTARHDHVEVRVVGQRRPSAGFSIRLRLRSLKPAPPQVWSTAVMPMRAPR